MTEFIVVKFNYWLLQWLQLFGTVVSILTFTKIDPTLTFHGWYLKSVANYKFRSGK
jgi:hypothetical protein